MGRRSDHSREEIRDMAISAAEKILTEEGVNGLSTRKVAKAIGYTVGTLYLTFKNLDELILHINAKTLDELYTQLHEAISTCEHKQACVEIMGRQYFQFAHDNHARWTLLYEYQTQEGFEIPEWYQEKIQRIFLLVEAKLTEIASHKDAAKIKLAAQGLWSGIHGLCVLNMKDKLSVVSDISVEILIKEFMSIFLAGYLADNITENAMNNE